MGKFETREGLIEAGEFRWEAKPWGPESYRNYNHAPAAGCIRVLRDAATDFDITVWGLARLLGLPWLHQIYAWLKGKKRPCQMYVVRLVKLYQLRKQGLNLDSVYFIDWDSGEIRLKGPRKKQRTSLSLSPQDQELRDRFMKYTPR